MNALLLVLFTLLFPLLHVLSAWVFQFAEISPHISLIYLPAFMRLANVLILGRLRGTLATMLGSMLLMPHFNENSLTVLLNSTCSAGGPLLALSLFSLHSKRQVDLTSLKDLGVLTLIYAISNALLHHAMWSIVDPSKLVDPVQVLWMVVGDVLGTLLGAYIMKWTLIGYRRRRLKIDR